MKQYYKAFQSKYINNIFFHHLFSQNAYKTDKHELPHQSVKHSSCTMVNNSTEFLNKTLKVISQIQEHVDNSIWNLEDTIFTIFFQEMLPNFVKLIRGLKGFFALYLQIVTGESEILKFWNTFFSIDAKIRH